MIGSEHATSRPLINFQSSARAARLPGVLGDDPPRRMPHGRPRATLEVSRVHTTVHRTLHSCARTTCATRRAAHTLSLGGFWRRRALLLLLLLGGDAHRTK